MIYVAIVCPDLPPSAPLVPRDALAREKIDRTENEKLRLERSVAYALLEAAHLDIYGEKMPPLFFDEDGKPRLSSGETRISISHTDGCVAVAFAKCEVGVDSECYAAMSNKERVLKRFVNENLQKSLVSAKSPDVSYRRYSLENGNELCLSAEFLGAERLEAAILNGSGDGDFSDSVIGNTARWTRLEALLKCGRGFGSIGSASALLEGAFIETARLGFAAVSVAAIKD